MKLKFNGSQQELQELCNNLNMFYDIEKIENCKNKAKISLHKKIVTYQDVVFMLDQISNGKLKRNTDNFGGVGYDDI